MPRMIEVIAFDRLFAKFSVGFMVELDVKVRGIVVDRPGHSLPSKQTSTTNSGRCAEMEARF